MAKVCVFNCADIEFDVYDSERIPIGVADSKYYITPKMIDEVDVWRKIKGVFRVTTAEHMEELIAVGLIGEYR